MRREWFARGHRRPDRAFRRPRRRRRPGAAARQRARRARRRRASGRPAFRERYYLEVQRAGRPDDDALVAATVALAGELALPVVATHPVQFLRARGFPRARSARVHRRGPRPRRHAPAAALHAGAVFQDAGRDGGALRRPARGARQQRRDRAALQPDDSARQEPPARLSRRRRASRIDEHLRNEARGGPRAAARGAVSRCRRCATRKRPEYVARLEFETTTIVQMGFAGYFLIVADFINWAQDATACRSGPGRGSGAGSLVAYALGITDLDPLRYALLFERFLNPERVSMPDFDIDFCQDGRDRVIDYVKKKYGADSVSQIATFGTMAAKAAVRDVGRVLDLPYLFRRRHRQADSVPARQARHAASAGAASERELRSRVEPLARARTEEEVRELLALAEAARRADAQRRHARRRRADRAGQAHRLLPAVRAAGRRRDRVAVRQGRRRGGRPRQVRLPRPDHAHDPRLDAALRAQARSARRRSTSRRCRSTTRRRTTSSRPATRPRCSSSNRAACASSLKQAPPTRFEDIIALVALYRPGPMELIPDYVARKSGRERVDYLDRAARADPRARRTA